MSDTTEMKLKEYKFRIKDCFDHFKLERYRIVDYKYNVPSYERCPIPKEVWGWAPINEWRFNTAEDAKKYAHFLTDGPQVVEEFTIERHISNPDSTT